MIDCRWCAGRPVSLIRRPVPKCQLHLETRKAEELHDCFHMTGDTRMISDMDVAAAMGRGAPTTNAFMQQLVLLIKEP